MHPWKRKCHHTSFIRKIFWEYSKKLWSSKIWKITIKTSLLSENFAFSSFFFQRFFLNNQNLKGHAFEELCIRSSVLFFSVIDRKRNKHSKKFSSALASKRTNGFQRSCTLLAPFSSFFGSWNNNRGQERERHKMIRWLFVAIFFPTSPLCSVS